MELRHGTPEEAGIVPETLEIIRSRAQQWVQLGKDQGMAFQAARRGVIFVDESFGSLGPEPDSPPLPKDALFPLASLTKPITATALMALVEDGLVGLNRPLQEYIPEFVGGEKDAVLVHHLLTHTSGLRDEDVMTLLEKEEETADLLPPEPTQHPEVNKDLSYMMHTPLWKMPGEEMAYASSNYYLVGELVRRLSRKSLASFAEERIFKPLGMKDTSYMVNEDRQVRVVRRPENAPNYILNSKNRMTIPSPSSGVYSTAADMARFAQMFLNQGKYGEQRILSPASVNAMIRNQIPGISARRLKEYFPEASWGFGWSIAHPFKSTFYGEALPPPGYFGHGGAGGVKLWVDPALELIGVYFAIALESDENDRAIFNGDLFLNMVTAGVRRSEFILATTGLEFPRGKKNKSPLTSPLQRAALEKDKLHTGTADKAGINAQRLRQLVVKAAEWVESGLYPSMEFVVARKGVVFLHEQFGRLGIEDDAPNMRAHTIFPLASVTKIISAVAVMILVDEGLVGLNRPLQTYIPGFQGEGKNQITVRHLLTHTTGMTDEAVLQQAVDSGLAFDPNHPEPTVAELISDYKHLLNLIFETPLSHAPNTMMSYAGIIYTLIGEVIEQASSMELSEFIQERIFDPLGMADSYMTLPESESVHLVRKPQGAPGFIMVPMLVKRKAISPSGGAFSTAMDMAVFGQMFLNGGTYNGHRILSPASVAAMTRNQIPGIPAVSGDETLPEAEWGFGWSVHIDGNSFAYDEPLLSQKAFLHGGDGGTFLWVDPTYELVATFFSTYLRYKENQLPDANHDLFINALIASIEDG